jgi:hypothetical protein
MKSIIILLLFILQSAVLPQNNFIQQITSGDFDARNPFIEPQFFITDSLKVFFELHKDGYSNIYFIKYNSSTQTFSDTVAITSEFAININPSFKSYAGLIFQSNRNGNWDIMFVPDSNYSFGEIRNLTNSIENEFSPKFVKYFPSGGPYDSTLVLFKRDNDIVLLSIKSNTTTEQVIFKGDNQHSYTEFSGMYYYNSWDLPRTGIYILAIEKDLNNIKKMVSRYKGNNGWEELRTVLDSCDCSDLTTETIDYQLVNVPVYQDSLNGNRRLFYLEDWETPKKPLELPIYYDGNIYNFHSYMSPQLTKISNVYSSSAEFFFPHTYLVEQNDKSKILLNLNDDAWLWQDTLVECSYNLPNIAIGPVGYAPGRGIVLYTMWEDSLNGHIQLFGRKEYASLGAIENESVVNDFILYQNYPNPFNPATNIEYKILKGSEIRFNVINILGEKVFEKNYGYQLPGNYKIDFDGSGLSSGIYLYSIYTSENRLSRKMLLLK